MVPYASQVVVTPSPWSESIVFVARELKRKLSEISNTTKQITNNMYVYVYYYIYIYIYSFIYTYM